MSLLTQAFCALIDLMHDLVGICTLTSTLQNVHSLDSENPSTGNVQHLIVQIILEAAGSRLKEHKSESCMKGNEQEVWCREQEGGSSVWI